MRGSGDYGKKLTKSLCPIKILYGFIFGAINLKSNPLAFSPNACQIYLD
jgi:hypothetical protein